MSETTNKKERRAAQERDWIERLMAAAPAGIFGEGPCLARGIVHPWCYRRARAEGADDRWDDPGWRPFYRIMVATVEEWCQHHQWSARRTVKRMTLEDMLWLWYKEKWGAMRWEVRATSALPRSLREVVANTARILEGASTCVCQRCGRASQIRQPQPTERNPYGGWVNSWCDECHRNTAHEERERDEAKRRAGGNGHAPRGSAPESRAETEVRIERYLASLRPLHGETDPWTYAEDVLEEWWAREKGERGAAMPRRAKHGFTAPGSAPARRTSHRVTLGRWRYEEAVVELDALDAEAAAALANWASVEWTPSARMGAAFVRNVEGDASQTLRTALRIEEQHGESARLEQALQARRENARACVREHLESRK